MHLFLGPIFYLRLDRTSFLSFCRLAGRQSFANDGPLATKCRALEELAFVALVIRVGKCSSPRFRGRVEAAPARLLACQLYSLRLILFAVDYRRPKHGGIDRTSAPFIFLAAAIYCTSTGGFGSVRCLNESNCAETSCYRFETMNSDRRNLLLLLRAKRPG